MSCPFSSAGCKIEQICSKAVLGGKSNFVNLIFSELHCVHPYFLSETVTGQLIDCIIIRSNITTLVSLRLTTGACIYVKNTVKKPEKPKFEVLEPKARRNETQQIVFHCVNEGFRMSVYGTRFK